jgi:hypothetical protein
MEGRSQERSGIAWPRAILLFVLTWWTLRLATGVGWIFVDYVNLAFHEAGHVFFSFAGSTVHFLGGTLGQLLVPAILVFYFLIYQGRPFGAAFCLWWIGQNLVNISVYMADARELALPLVGGGDHDWNELFFRWGLLAEPSVERVSGLTHFFGVVIMLLGLAWCAFFVLPHATRRNFQYRLTSRWPWLDLALDC